MSKAALLTALYGLVTDMTTAEGYSGDWEAVRSWDNGAFICEEAPKLSIRLLPDLNNDIANGVGIISNNSRYPSRYATGRR